LLDKPVVVGVEVVSVADSVAGRAISKVEVVDDEPRHGDGDGEDDEEKACIQWFLSSM